MNFLCPSCSSEPCAGLSIGNSISFSSFHALLTLQGLEAWDVPLSESLQSELQYGVSAHRRFGKQKRSRSPFYWSFDSRQQIHGLQQGTDFWLFSFDSPALMLSLAIMICYPLCSYSFLTVSWHRLRTSHELRRPPWFPTVLPTTPSTLNSLH